MHNFFLLALPLNGRNALLVTDSIWLLLCGEDYYTSFHDTLRHKTYISSSHSNVRAVVKESMPRDYLNGLLYSMSNDLYPNNCLPFPVENKNALQKNKHILYKRILHHFHHKDY